ncbi:MAG: hypothetical protein Q8N99_05415 [Nanoarchaeota archaeon]|nr:hypothetical protein [Nanoarchaeota archaeon]
MRKKKEVKRKAQITIFVIIGVLIVSFILAYFFSIREHPESDISPIINPLHNYISTCVKNTGEEAIYYIGTTGGYVAPPVNYSTDLDIAYYIYQGKDLMPDKEILEKELSLYMDNFLYYCLEDFRDFPDFSVKYKDLKTLAKIDDNKVSFNVEFPLTVTKDKKKYFFKNFYAEVPVRLGKIYNIAKEIKDEQMKRDDVCLTCLYTLSEENNVTIHMLEASNDSIVFLINDNKSKLYQRDYSFYFANKLRSEK